MNFDWRQTLRTISGFVTGAVGILAAAAKCTGDNPLTPLVTEPTVCTAAWLPPQYAAYAAMAYAGMELFLKATRPGGWLAGWFGQSVLVTPTGAVGTVTQTQVDTGPKK